MSFLSQFRLPSTSRKSTVVTGLSAPPTMLCLDLCVPNPDESEGIGSPSAAGSPSNMDDPESKGTRSSRANTPDNAKSPATSKWAGSFNWDQAEGGYTLEWADLAKFELWHQTEECLGCIEFIASSTRTGGILWSQWQHFVCGCEDSGGNRNYEKKHLDRQCKLEEDRKSGCSCHIDIKQYPHTPTVQGRYIDKHDHEIGAANIAYTRLSGSTQEQIKSMLRQRIDRHEIVSCRNQNSLATDLIYLKARVVREAAPEGSRD